MRIVQICHGSIIPKYTSAYSLKVWNYLEPVKDRRLLSTGGLVLKDSSNGRATQFRSILLMIISLIKGKRSFEILLSKGFLVRRKYLRACRHYIKTSDVIIFEGPWQFRLFQEYLQGKTVVYDAHNVESDLRKGDPNQHYVFALEKEMIISSSLVITMTDEDRKNMIQLYEIPTDKIICIKEEFAVPRHTWTGISSKEIAFIGSAYGPNIEAVKFIMNIAEELNEFQFKIIGNVSSAIKKARAPKNVRFLGVLTDEKKSIELCNSFIAINPVKTGSGMNLKMNDYVSHGVPIITTDVGARGFEEILKDKFFIKPLEDFPNTILDVSNRRNDLKNISSFFLTYAREHSYTETMKAAMQAIETVYEANKKSI